MMHKHKTVAEEHLLSIREVIDVLSVPRHTIHQWIEKGTLIPVRMAGALRFRPEDVRALFEREGNGGSGGRILVIDDDPLVGKSLKNLLETNGYEAQVASLGLAALDFASRERFDLIVTDIRMPGMNGTETLKAIRRIRSLSGKPPLPEIVITAFEDGAVKEEVQRLGVSDFILKPFEIEELLTALERNLKPGRNRTAYAF
jgi:excisionase family DNA binding protein